MKSSKRIFAIVMVMAMVFSLVAINASAETYVGTIAGYNIVDGPITGTGITGTVNYDAANHTLTLDKATITYGGTSPAIDIVDSTNDYTIVVKGNCSIVLSSQKNGIDTSSNTTLIGENNASLTISTNTFCGILCRDGNLTINNLILTSDVTNGGDNDFCCALRTNTGDITINKSTIVAKDSSNCFRRGIYADNGDITINNSTLDITARLGGIMSNNGNVTITDTKTDTNAKITSKNIGSFGIYAGNNITFAGKDVIEVEAGFIPVISNTGNIIFDLTAGAKVHAKKYDDPNITTYCAAFHAIGGITLTSGAITLPENGKINTTTVTTPQGNMSYTRITKQDGIDVEEATVEFNEYVIETPVAELTWEKGCCDVLIVTSNAEYNKFSKILVDDAEVAEQDSSKDYKNYSIMSGSTKVLLTAGYLETLAVGDHTIEIVSKDGSAKGTFTIVEAAVTEEPTTKKEETKTEEKVADTADNSAIGAFVALGAFAAVGYVSLKKRED